MARTKNEGIGKGGEKRIHEKLLPLVKEVTLNQNHNAHPDLKFTHNGIEFWAECKTVQGVYEGRIGQIKIRPDEIANMEERGENVTPCLIVEIRPTKANKKDYIYIYVPWGGVRERYKRTNPSLLSLSIWWILKNGVCLDWYLTGLGLIK